MTQTQTLLGFVGGVTGSTVHVDVAAAVASGLAIIDGSTYRVAQVGSFVRIPLGYQDLFGVVSGVGVNAVPESLRQLPTGSAQWMKVQLVGEAIGASFERGISQHPNVGDAVHLVTEADLARIYGSARIGQEVIGRLSSAENIEVRIDLDKLVTRHSAVLGSTGSGKSTTVASLLRSIAAPQKEGTIFKYPSARVLLIDIHGEYSAALGDLSTVFRINPNHGERELNIPYWAMDPTALLDFLTGGISEDKLYHIYDKITDLKRESLKARKFAGVAESSLTVATPIPYSLKKLWYDLIDIEVRTFTGSDKSTLALISEGDAETLVQPQYKPHAMGPVGPFLNNAAPGLKRQINNLRSRLLDRQFDFLLHPGDWEPDLSGVSKKDLPEILHDWLGSESPITILDLSGVPSPVLLQLVGSILQIVYEAIFWSREKSEGGIERPLLIVMEEAHRYLLGGEDSNLAREMTQRIVKEGRKYGIGAMVVSQRPSEVDETILSQCGTFIALRLANPVDRQRVQGTLPDNLGPLMDMLPVLRTGEAIVTGEAARMPLRCRITLPAQDQRPSSEDPLVANKWSLPRRKESYERVAMSWRAQSPREKDQQINRVAVSDSPTAAEK